MKNYTKQDLIRAVEEALGPDADAELIVQATLDTIVEGLRNGEAIEVRGFGSFHTRQRGGRLAHSPRTGEAVEVPPKAIAFFRASFDVSGD